MVVVIPVGGGNPRVLPQDAHDFGERGLADRALLAPALGLGHLHPLAEAVQAEEMPTERDHGVVRGVVADGALESPVGELPRRGTRHAGGTGWVDCHWAWSHGNAVGVDLSATCCGVVAQAAGRLCECCF